MNCKVFFTLLVFTNLTTCMGFNIDREIVGFRVVPHFLGLCSLAVFFYRDDNFQILKSEIVLKRSLTGKNPYLETSQNTYTVGKRQPLVFENFSLPPEANYALKRMKRSPFTWGAQP